MFINSPQMNSGVPKPDPSEHAGKVHVGPGLQVLWVLHGSVVEPAINQTICCYDPNQNCFSQNLHNGSGSRSDLVPDQTWTSQNL